MASYTFNQVANQPGNPSRNCCNDHYAKAFHPEWTFLLSLQQNNLRF